MKKGLWVVLLLSMMILSACTKTEEKEQANHLEFPQLTWDMTPEDVLEVFQTAKEDALMYDENSATTSFGIADLDVFGQKAERVFFNFIDFSSFDQMPKQEEGAPRLCQIRVYYPQDTDLQPVKEKMEQAYGATVPQYYRFDRTMGMGMEDDRAMRLEPLEESESLKYWGSSTLGDTLAEQDPEKYKTYWKYCRAGLNDENWDFFKDHARMVSIIFSDQEGDAGKGLEWDAHNFAVYQVINKLEA